MNMNSKGTEMSDEQLPVCANCRFPAGCTAHGSCRLKFERSEHQAKASGPTAAYSHSMYLRRDDGEKESRAPSGDAPALTDEQINAVIRSIPAFAVCTKETGFGLQVFLHEFARAVLALQPAVQGEPTPEMIRAGIRAVLDLDSGRSWEEALAAGFRAMCAAQPVVPLDAPANSIHQEHLAASSLRETAACLTTDMPEIKAWMLGEIARQAGDPSRTDVDDPADRGRILLELLNRERFCVVERP